MALLAIKSGKFERANFRIRKILHKVKGHAFSAIWDWKVAALLDLWTCGSKDTGREASGLVYLYIHWLNMIK
jgi:hypothetical protein